MRQSMFNSKFLIVDDEKDISNLIEMALKSNGFSSIEKVYDGSDVIEKVNAWQPNLILLDLMLPKVDGLTICKELKNNSSTANIPIIIITAKSEESDIVVGLELGANDYITKPFSTKVLIARIRNQLRTPDVDNKENFNVHYKDIVINKLNRSATLNNKELNLTYSEFELLTLFAEHPSRVFTRNQLLLQLKGDAGYDIGERAIDVQVLNLRRKLGSLGTDIEAVRGIGYRLNEKTFYIYNYRYDCHRNWLAYKPVFQILRLLYERRKRRNRSSTVVG